MFILIVDDEIHLRKSLSAVLQSEHEVQTCENGAMALELLKKSRFDLCITDHQMPGLTGLELIKNGKQVSPETSFLLMTAFGDVNQAVKAIQLGADDYFLKPFEISELEHRVQRVSQLRRWKAHSLYERETKKNSHRLIGRSSAIQNAKAFIEKVADSDAPVLILGPSGTGKEVLAKSIHENSERVEMAFIGINCASLNENLIESELFGHEKGAFTGATNSKPGKFELARGGTLFLDEIGEMPPSLQAKLLRVLQEKEFTRVGGVKTIKAEVRVIAATHRDLKVMTTTGQFREDLYFRLNVLSFNLPPLCERREDLIDLIEVFWKKACEDSDHRSQLSPEIIHQLMKYSFPGNIRELQNILQRLAVLGPTEGLVPLQLLPPEILGNISPFPPSARPEIGSDELGLEESLAQIEKKLIDEAMNKCSQNQTKAAQLLKVTRGTLQYKLKKYAA